MTQTQLEELVVKISADVSGLVKAAETGKKVLDQLNNSSKAMVDQVGRLTGQLRNFAGGVAAAFGAIGLHLGFGSMLSAWKTQEEAVIGLNAVLRANGREVDTLSRDYQDFASKVQEGSVFGDEYVISLLKTAETYRITGDAAKQAAKDSLALATINGSSASAMMRITAAMAQGDVQKAMRMGRLVKQLRGIKDEAEFVVEYEKLVRAGTEMMGTIAQTASGRIQQLKNAMGDFAEDLGKATAEVIKPFVEVLIQFGKWFRSLSPEVQSTTAKVILFTTAILGLGPALRVLSMLTWPVTYLASIALMIVKQIILIGLWIAWKAVLLGVLILIAPLIAGVLAYKAAVWLLNAALTVTNVLMAVATGTLIVAMVAAMALLYAGVMGVVAAIGAFVTGMAEMWSAVSSSSSLGGLFREWGGIIQDIWQAMRVNMPLAFDMMKTAFSLAVAEVKSIAPSLWNFLRVGFSEVWDYVTESFQKKFAETMQSMSGLFGVLLGNAGARLVEDATRQAASINLEQRLADMQRRIARAGNAIGFEETAEIRRLKNEYQKLKDILNNPDQAAAYESGERIGGAMSAGIRKELGKFDSVLYGSAEALARIASYSARYAEVKPGASRDVETVQRYVLPAIQQVRDQTAYDVGIGRAASSASGRLVPSEAVQDQVARGAAAEGLRQGVEDRSQDILQEILDELKRQGRTSGVQLQISGRGGG